MMIRIATEWQVTDNRWFFELHRILQEEGHHGGGLQLPNDDQPGVMIFDVTPGMLGDALRHFSDMDFLTEEMSNEVSLVGLRVIRNEPSTPADQYDDFLLEEINHLAGSVSTLYRALDAMNHTVGGLTHAMDELKGEMNALKVGHSQASTFSQLVGVVTQLAVDTGNEDLVEDLKVVTIQ